MQSAIPYIGSFQQEGNKIVTEEPLEEVWSRISRYGSFSYLKNTFKPDKPGINWDKYLRYIEVRIRQAVELRKVAHQSSLLTSPLNYYYSFLNLKRAFLALGPEIIPKKRHGLVFKPAANLLDTKALLSEGTFTDYLKTKGIKWNKNDGISLSEALGFIVELADDYRHEYHDKCFVSQIVIRGIMNGPVKLQYYNISEDFKDTWKIAYPGLADFCQIEQEGKSLGLKDIESYKSYEAISEFAHYNLLPSLIYSWNPIWYIYNDNNNVLKLTRSGYYYVTMFILGNAVRYNPELMLEASSLGSELFWLLQKFISLAERYYPQLKLMEFYRSQLYFSSD